jgi:branched-chain amino acid transport system permease protein
MGAWLQPGLARRATLLMGGFLLALLILPAVAGDYLLSVMILVLYSAYVGQAWNVMTGFAGQLSLGHALYVGLGAYASAALLVHFHLGPWLGMWVAMAISMAAGAAIGFLAFRFGIGGTYFALLTIAFAEFTRIGFDHFKWVGASAGFFLPVAQRTHNDWLNLRGTPTMFYYVMLALTAGAFALCHLLMRSRVGYYWLAIREDPDAAQALGINTFRYKMMASLLSSAMTALAGVFFAFYYNNLFPEQIFNIGRSIEIILGPIIGGLGSLFGPIVGAFLLTLLGEGLRLGMDAMKWDVPGITQVFYGVCLLAVVMFLPNGLWPPLKRLLGLDPQRAGKAGGKDQPV